MHLLKCAHSEQEPPKEIDNANVLSAYEDLEQYRWTAQEHDAYIRSKLAMEAEEIKIEEYLEKIMLLEQKVEQAEVKGKLEHSIEIARKMLAKGKTIEEIAELTDLSIEHIKNIIL